MALFTVTLCWLPAYWPEHFYKRSIGEFLLVIQQSFTCKLTLQCESWWTYGLGQLTFWIWNGDWKMISAWTILVLDLVDLSGVRRWGQIESCSFIRSETNTVGGILVHWLPAKLQRNFIPQLREHVACIWHLSNLDATVDGLELFELLESYKKIGDLSGLIGGGLEHWCFKLLVFNFALDILDWRFILSAVI